jgi:hypothetical protein
MTQENTEGLAEKAFVRKIQGALDEKVDRDGLETLSSDERVVYLSLWTRVVIGNGGFQYFFEGEYSLSEVRDGFAALGLKGLAGACGQVLSALSSEARSNSERRKYLAAVPRENQREFARPFWNTTYDDVSAAVARFVRGRPDAFGVSVA